MIISAKKIKPIEKNKPKITLKKVFQGYKQSSQKDNKTEPNKNKRGNVKNKKKNKSKY